MQIDRKAFFDGYRSRYGKLSQAQVDGLEALLTEIERDEEVTDPRWVAYMLATVKHECADTFRPITERGRLTYFNKYEPTTPIGKRLGNRQKGDGYLFRGRGYVQITGRANYQRLAKDIGLPDTDALVRNPDEALQPAVAYRIMSVGMRKGRFTGKKLADYINQQACDYRNARRIINALDQADRIQQYARDFEELLGESAK